MKIPENANPYRAIVNGVEHAYEAGAETEVADGVEELINAADNFPPAAEEVQPPFSGGGGGSLVVTLTEKEGVISTDKTAGEIFAALPNVTAIFPSGFFTNVMTLLSYARDGEETTLLYKPLLGGSDITLYGDSMNSVMTGEGGGGK